MMMEEEGGALLCFPQLLNASCRRLARPHYEHVSLFVLLFGISLLTAALNLLVIISILHFRKLHTQTNLLLLSLAFSDFLMGTFVMPIEALRIITGCWFLGDLMCNYIFPFITLVIVSSSVGTLVLIAVDRYVAICEPLQYTNKITIRRVKGTVCLCWACTVSYNVVLMKVGVTHLRHADSCYGECNVIVSYVVGVIDTVVTFIGPVTVIIVLYGRVFVVAVSQARAMKSHSFTAGQLGTPSKSELKAARTIGTVIFLFLLCFCPYYFPLFAGGDNDVAFALPILLWVMYLNSCVNPLIYAFFYPWFRKSIKLIVTLQILQPSSSDINLLSGQTMERSK